MPAAMAIFKRKTRKDDEKPKDAPAVAPEMSAKQPYKHKPSHAAFDSVGQAGRVDGTAERVQVSTASKQRLQSSRYDSALGDASYAQSIAFELAHGTSSPGGPYSPSMRGRLSEEALQTQVSGQPEMPRSSSDYFWQPARQTASYTGKGKELSCAVPSNYPDSGYESGSAPSAPHSRTPSLQNLSRHARSIVARDDDGFFLPDPSLNREPLGRSTRTELSYARTGQLEGRAVSPIDADTDARSIKSTKSNTSVTKRTRFEDFPDPMPPLDQLQTHLVKANRQKKQGPVEALTALPQVPISGTSSDAESESSHREDERAASKGTMQAGSSHSESHKRHPSVTESLSQALSAVTALVSEQPWLPTLEIITSAASARRATLPPLSILEGLRVNKKGKILDEEGDPIGELVEGDLLDCVRQKANEKGEVLDEHGRVVGIVRTIAATVTPPVDHPTQPSEFPKEEDGKFDRRQFLINNRSAPVLTGPNAVVKQSPPQSIHAMDDSSEILSQPSPPKRSVHPALRPHGQQEPVAEEKGAPITEAKHSRSHAVTESPVAILPTARDFGASEQSRRPARSASERSLSELSKSYARPLMSAVPEDVVPDDETTFAYASIFAYKGEIPLDDGPQQEARNRSRSPQVVTNPKMAYTMGYTNSGLLSPNQNGRMGPRRATTHFAGTQQSSTQGLGPRPISTSALKGSPLSSQETSPKRSDSDGFQRPVHNRSSSAMSATSSRSRTYFAHPKSAAAAEPAPKAVESPAAELHKKKNRMSFGFSKKNKSAAK